MKEGKGKTPVYTYIGNTVPCYSTLHEPQPEGAPLVRDIEMFDTVIYLKVNERHSAQPERQLNPAFEKINQQWGKLIQFPEPLNNPEMPYELHRKQLQDEVRITVSAADEEASRAIATHLMQSIANHLQCDVREKRPMVDMRGRS